MKEKKNARQNDTSLNIICVDNYFATFAYCNIETKKYNYKLHFINENVIYRQCFIIKLIEWNIFFSFGWKRNQMPANPSPEILSC